MGKLSTTNHLKDHIPWSSGVYPWDASTDQHTKVNKYYTLFINRMKNKKHMIISTDAEKNLTNFNTFHDKDSHQISYIKGMNINVIKASYYKPTTNILVKGEKRKSFSSKIRIQNQHAKKQLHFYTLTAKLCLKKKFRKQLHLQKHQK